MNHPEQNSDPEGSTSSNAPTSLHAKQTEGPSLKTDALLTEEESDKAALLRIRNQMMDRFKQQFPHGARMDLSQSSFLE